MKMVIRAVIIGLLAIIGLTAALKSQQGVVEQQQLYEKEAEQIYRAQTIKNCEQTLESEFCQGPEDEEKTRDKYQRWLCSDRLSSFGCSEYFDVADFILEEHQNRKPRKPWWLEKNKEKQ
jgi:hypothetical protein